MLLGFNGSPKPDSNLRRIIDMMLKESGKDYRIYDLAQMNIKPYMFQKFETDNQNVKRVKEIGRRLGSI